MAAQYAGWKIALPEYFAMGSGPMRAVAAKEDLFTAIGHVEQSDIAVGNIVGSNIFNILAVVGFPGLVAPLRVGADVISRDGSVMLFAAVLMLPIFRTGHVVSRLEGLLLLMLYAGYLTWITW